MKCFISVHTRLSLVNPSFVSFVSQMYNYLSKNSKKSQEAPLCLLYSLSQEAE